MMKIQRILLRDIVKSFDVFDPIIYEQSLDAELVSVLDSKYEDKVFFIGIVKSGMVSYTLFTKKTD
jgi:hypothetical protein